MQRFLVLSYAILLCLQPINTSIWAQGIFNNFRLIGVHYNKYDNRYWIAVAAINPRYLPGSYDYLDKFTVTFRSGERDIIYRPGEINVVPLDQYAASATKLMRVSLVIDNSGSIDDQTLEFVESTLEKFVQRMPVALDMQVIKFSDEILPSAFSQDKGQIVGWIREPMDRGGTKLHDAIMSAVRELMTVGDDVPLRAVIVFTDGKDTASEEFPDTYSFARILNAEAQQAKIPILAVGVTPEVDEWLLKEITHFGVYQHADRFPDLEQAFQRLEQLIKSIVIVRVPKVGNPEQITQLYLGEMTHLNQPPQTIQDFAVSFR